MLSGGQILEFPQPALTFPIGYDPKEPFKVGFLVGSDGVCYWPLFEPILFIVKCETCGKSFSRKPHLKKHIHIVCQKQNKT